MRFCRVPPTDLSISRVSGTSVVCCQSRMEWKILKKNFFYLNPVNIQFAVCCVCRYPSAAAPSVPPGLVKLVGFFDYLVSLALFCLFRMRNESATPRPCLPRPTRRVFRAHSAGECCPMCTCALQSILALTQQPNCHLSSFI